MGWTSRGKSKSMMNMPDPYARCKSFVLFTNTIIIAIINYFVTKKLITIKFLIIIIINILF